MGRRFNIKFNVFLQKIVKGGEWIGLLIGIKHFNILDKNFFFLLNQKRSDIFIVAKSLHDF